MLGSSIAHTEQSEEHAFLRWNLIICLSCTPHGIMVRTEGSCCWRLIQGRDSPLSYRGQEHTALHISFCMRVSFRHERCAFRSPSLSRRARFMSQVQSKRHSRGSRTSMRCFKARIILALSPLPYTVLRRPSFPVFAPMS